jgi:hypothetical protein
VVTTAIAAVAAAVAVVAAVVAAATAVDFFLRTRCVARGDRGLYRAGIRNPVRYEF